MQRHKRHEFDPWVGKIPWRRKWQLPPGFLPGESREQRSLVSYRARHDLSDLARMQFYPDVFFLSQNPIQDVA